MILLLIAIFLLFPPVKPRKGIMTIAPPIKEPVEFPSFAKRWLIQERLLKLGQPAFRCNIQKVGLFVYRNKPVYGSNGFCWVRFPTLPLISSIMAYKSEIQWTDATWNIAVGCTKVDSDCKFCYMYRDSMKETRYNPKDVRKTKTVFNSPLKWKEPKKIFTSSLTDFFHEGCDSFRDEAWDIIRKCPQHTFQILTKRPERIHNHLPDFWEEIKDRVWLGTSVGSLSGMTRLYDLLESKADCLYFLSLEPLHGEMTLPLYDTYGRDLNRYKVKDALSWVIVGGESGNDSGLYRYRPCKLEWIEKIVNQCSENNIAVFVKQLGTHLSKEMKLNDRHGGDIDEFPEHLKIRQFP